MTERKWIRTEDWNAWVQFMFDNVPEILKKRVHDHEKHRDEKEDISILEFEALKFILEDCKIIKPQGTSEENFAVEYDEDLLCLYNAIHRFMETGSREDAFDVYYCFIDIFIEKHEQARKLIEMLSDYENNASNLVVKHRDHYSHSVYVFVTGLAIYHCNVKYRGFYSKTYYDGVSADDSDKAYDFLRYWGTTALFHDVGYPFEIPFEQIKSYFNPKMEESYNEQIPFIAYRQMENILSLSDLLDNEADIAKLLEVKVENIPKNPTIAHVIAHHIVRKLERCRFISGAVDVEAYIRGILLSKPISPESNNYYMDHALFSSLLLFRKMLEIIGIKNILNDYETNKMNYYAWMDTLTAIVMHNSLFKFKLRTVYESVESKEKLFEVKEVPLGAGEHSLAYLLMLCDELQCWDRSSYGKESKRELHAADCEFLFEENGIINARYLFEKDESAISFKDNGEILDVKKGTFAKFFYSKKKTIITENNEKKKVPDYYKKDNNFNPLKNNTASWKIDFDSNQAQNCKFIKDIAEIVNLYDLYNKDEKEEPKFALKVSAEMSNNNRYRLSTLSNIRLISIYNYARLLYYRLYNNSDKDCTFDINDESEDLFKKESLAVKLSYIQVVKKMAEYLEKIGIFYSDETKPFSRISSFNNILHWGEIRSIISLENERQNLERVQMLHGGAASSVFFNELDKNPSFAARYVRCILKSNERREEKRFITFPIYKVIEKMLDILVNWCNVYYYPGKNIITVDKKAPENTLRIKMQDLSGRVIKEYSMDDLKIETTNDNVCPEWDYIMIAHIKEFYREYEIDPDKTETNEDSGMPPVFYYKYDDFGEGYYLRLETDQEDDFGNITCSLSIVYYQIGEDGKPIKTDGINIDRSMFYTDQNFDCVFLRQTIDGGICIPYIPEDD